MYFPLHFLRNPNKFGNGSWTTTYWPVHSPIRKEYLTLSPKNKTIGYGLRARKCAFWKTYLPSLLGEKMNYDDHVIFASVLSSGMSEAGKAVKRELWRM